MVSDLVQIIVALIGNLFMQGGDSRKSLLLPVTVFRLARGVPLQTAQLQQIIFQPTRIIDEGSIRESNEIFQTQVYANLFVLRLMQCDLFRQLYHEAYIPSSVYLFYYSMCYFRILRDRAMEAHSYFTHVLDVKVYTPIFTLAQLAAISISVFYALKTIAAFETWEAWCFTSFQSTKERLERLIQTAQQLLQTRSVQLAKGFRITSAQVTKVRPLRGVADSLTHYLVGSDTLLQSSIVDRSGLPQ